MTLAIQFASLGPYHVARIAAAAARLQKQGWRVVALETCRQVELYPWEPVAAANFERVTVFPSTSYFSIPSRFMWRNTYQVLQTLEPDVIAIPGYRAADSLAALFWCKRHRRPAILMSESKQDDAPRQRSKEWAKRQLVKQFAAAICGGDSHRAYLSSLGIRPERIMDGYDVIDNAYFQQQAAQVRQNPDGVATLAGLETAVPYFLASARFVRRKNLDRLLLAYARYRRLCATAETIMPWRLVILGDGHERPQLQALIAELRLTTVSLPGFQQITTLPAYYARAGAFIHPARQEPWGLVVNEAMAAGLPLLVSNRCGCVPNLVLEGVNGYTFDPDDIDSLARLMFQFTAGAVDLAQMGQASSRIIAAWGPDRFAHGLAKLVSDFPTGASHRKN